MRRLFAPHTVQITKATVRTAFAAPQLCSASSSSIFGCFAEICHYISVTYATSRKCFRLRRLFNTHRPVRMSPFFVFFSFIYGVFGVFSASPHKPTNPEIQQNQMPTTANLPNLAESLA